MKKSISSDDTALLLANWRDDKAPVWVAFSGKDDTSGTFLGWVTPTPSEWFISGRRLSLAFTLERAECAYDDTRDADRSVQERFVCFIELRWPAEGEGCVLYELRGRPTREA